MNAFTRRTLGKTGLQVSPLGIGGGNGICSEDVLYAFEHGINYFFFSSDLHHWMYQRSAQALRTLCKRGSSVRDQVVLATVSYVNDPEKIPALLSDLFYELQVDYIDVFHWGWVTDDTPYDSLLEAAQELKAGGTLARRFLPFFQRATAINEDLMKRGLVRYVGSSFHSRSMARTYMHDVDVVMIRYNIAHTGVEQDVVPFLSGEETQDPGMVVFNVAYSSPNSSTPGAYAPTIPDCYRFALSQPWVDIVLTGVTSRQEIDQALAVVEQGPLSDDEDAAMRTYGALQLKRHSKVSG